MQNVYYITKESKNLPKDRINLNIKKLDMGLYKTSVMAYIGYKSIKYA